MASASRKTKKILKSIDMDQKLGARSYFKKLTKLQIKLAQIQQAYLVHGHSGVIVMEGWDAAGKGGTIRRISAALDPRNFKVWPIGAPRRYYLARHHLLRFMERMPPNGAISVFDRSWYGRVLVERVEELTPRARWMNGYREINEFERMITDDGTKIVKLFFHITPEVQLARLEERIRNPMKRWKLSYEDFRNRSRWDEYENAIEDMLAKTSTRHAPWCVIPGNQKKFARISAIEEVIRRLGKGIDLEPPLLDRDIIDAATDHMDIEDSLLTSLRGRTD
jgi:polyphosphate kinase 2 (PPK2 family)